MKYVEARITFAEVPGEISLSISISGCKNSCIDCHSPHLHEDIGNKLDWGSLNSLIHINSGITCVCFLGGDSDPHHISKLAYDVRRLGLKVCWYSGCDSISKDIDIRNFDYIKIGHYDREKGPLTSETTNQVMYEVVHGKDDFNEETTELKDITYKFWKHGN